jgi:lipoprotein
MKTPPTKRSFQAALALTLLACSGLAGCSESQEQSGSSSANSKAAAATAHTKAGTATPKAGGTPTVTDTPSATASPTLIMTSELVEAKKQALATPPPPKPELITVNSDDGAIATAKYWVQLDYYIYTTGKTSEYKELCPGTSYTATTHVEHAKENHALGGWTDPVTVKFTKAFRRDDFKDTVVIQVEFEREAFTQYHSEGRIQHYEKQLRWAGVKLEYNGTQWIVIEAANRAD